MVVEGEEKIEHLLIHNGGKEKKRGIQKTR